MDDEPRTIYHEPGPYEVEVDPDWQDEADCHPWHRLYSTDPRRDRWTAVKSPEVGCWKCRDAGFVPDPDDDPEVEETRKRRDQRRREARAILFVGRDRDGQ